MIRTAVLASLAALAATSATAADLPRKTVAPVFAAEPVHSWTGFYVGVNAGYAWSADKNVNFAPGADPVGAVAGVLAAGQLPRTLGIDAKGFMGGIQFGYNHQFAGTAFVAGLEADFQYADVRGGASFTNPLVPTFLQANSRLQYFGTVRGRLGFAVTPSFLLYATGGLAYGQVKYDGFGTGPGVFVTTESSKTHFGWTLGVGGEYAFTRNVSMKLEYLYYDIGKSSGQSSPFQGGPFSTLAFERKNTGHIARIGLNYRF
jgi:outer membrane immunogenic protein